MLVSKMVPVNGSSIATYSFGEGPPVIFLHGGPGDTHDYMVRMAEPIFKEYRCIFFDQRGSGKSQSFVRSKEDFTVERLLADLVTIKDHFKLQNVTLVGHSWGAMYALFACVQNPEEWSKAALLSMGLLNSKLSEQTANHLMSVLSEQEKQAWQRLHSERNGARDKGDAESVATFDKELMSLRVKTWIFEPDLRAKFLAEYFQDPPPDREINKLIWENAKGWFSWGQLTRIKSKLWICTGKNDSVPVSQTIRIAISTPMTTTSVLDKCGHIPWLEHEGLFYSDLRRFLSS